ncbi:hypothetical protein B566_EDAN013690 [Ephemera danica]|nr:hypothetical protein B566_EDAN013690 [Ephemera danica]
MWSGLSAHKHLTQPADKLLSMPGWWAARGHTMTSTRIIRRPAPVRENVDDIAFPTREDIKRKHGHQLTPKFRFRQQMGVKEVASSHDFSRTAFIVEPPRKK